MQRITGNLFIVRICVVAALGGLLFGYDTAIISGTIPLIKDYFSLNESGLGWAVGCILIGCGVGALIAGKLMDLKGRRYVLVLCALLFALSGIGIAYAQSLVVFVLFRVIGGLGVGAAAMVSPVYISEMAPAKSRGRFVSVYQLAIVTGILLAYFVNYLLVGLGPESWRWMFGSQVIPSALFLFFLMFVPETPRWLVRMSRPQDALKILAKIGGDEYAVNELLKIRLSFENHRKSGLGDLFSGKYSKVILVGLAVAIFQQITGINAILYYAPVIFKETGIADSSALLQTIGIGVINLVATFIAIGFVDKVGRKKFLLTGSILMGLSMTIVAACFHYHYFRNYVVLIGTLVYVASFGCTLGAVTWVYLSEIFPNRIRGLAMSVSTLALWLADFLVSYTFPMLTKHFGTAGTLTLYAICCGLSALFVFWKVPETKGRSLEDIEQLF